MFIEINNAKTVHEIQEEFHFHYPFLKLEFFDSDHFWSELSPQSDLIPATAVIGDIRKTHTPGLIEITGAQKTGTVEQHFERHFNLHVQICRLSGTTWIQTAGTDELTLDEQNELGRIHSENEVSAESDNY